ncbi:hypothetical protein LTR53_011654 [Teratosphaeriaceae sp. CCFEE 6253]|nr:hypothetical protein LTR53_011654 [Teratosphaeriaceae sp. CCFEE 6253]
MAVSSRLMSACLLTLLLGLIAVPTADALSIQKKAAIGISVGFGTLLIMAAMGGTYLVFYKRKARREARERGEVEMNVPKYTNKELIEMHAQTAPRGFNIWGDEQPDLDEVRRKMAARQQREQEQEQEDGR